MNGIGTSGSGTMFMGPIRYGGTERGFLALWYDEILIFTQGRVEEILEFEEISSLGCVPCTYPSLS